jgi:Killing trait
MRYQLMSAAIVAAKRPQTKEYNTMANSLPEIIDAVTATNVKVVAESPAMAMGTLYQSLAHSTGILFENSVSASRNADMVGLAATNQGIMQIYSVDTITDAVSVAQIIAANAAS